MESFHALLDRCVAHLRNRRQRLRGLAGGDSSSDPGQVGNQCDQKGGNLPDGWVASAPCTHCGRRRAWQKSGPPVPADWPCPCKGSPDGVPREGPVQPREGPEQPVEQYETRETGFYQAPPRTGAVQGPARSFGVNLGGFTLPEIRVRLPSFELPCINRTHQAARMAINPAEAPWVSTGSETVRVGPPAAAGAYAARGGPADVAEVDEEPAPDTREGPEEDCRGARREYERKIEELNRQLEECERLKQALQQYFDRNGEGAKMLDSDPAGDPSETLLPPKPQVCDPPQPRVDDNVRSPVPGGLQSANYQETIPPRRPPAILRLPHTQPPQRLTPR